MTPMKAIRAKCLDCCCDQQAEVRRCPSKDCALWPYRMGHRPAKEVCGDDGGDEKPRKNRGKTGVIRAYLREEAADAVC